MKMPDNITLDNMTRDDLENLLSVVPNIMSYVADCVTPEGKEDLSCVVIQIAAGCEDRRWGVELKFPTRVLDGIAHIEGKTIARSSTVLEQLIHLAENGDGLVKTKGSQTGIQAPDPTPVPEEEPYGDDGYDIPLS